MTALTDQQRRDLRSSIARIHREVHARRRRRALRRCAALVAALTTFVYLVSAGAATFEVTRAIGAAEQVLSATSTPLLSGNAGSLLPIERNANAARQDLRRARVALTPWSPLLARLGWLPIYGPLVASVDPMMDSASCLLGATAATAEVGDTLASRVDQNGSTIRDVQGALGALQRQAPTIATAQRDLGCATTARKAIDPRLNESSGLPGRELKRLDSGLAEADDVVHTLALLPPAATALFGVGSPRSYLVLGQDPFELRATGGFIGGLGLIRVSNGAITSLDYRGVLDFEPPNKQPLPPPAPLVKYMGLAGWYLRDGNWSPDFPTAARQVEQFFRADQGVQADGVIALDLYAVQDLLAATGPLYLPDFREMVSAETVLSQLWAHINVSGSAGPQREQDKTAYLNVLVSALMRRLEEPDAVALPRLLTALSTAIQERHLLIYTANPDAESLVSRLGAAGTVWNGPGDSLEVVDTHVSYGKMAAMVDEALSLDVTVGPNGQVISDTLTVQYANKYDERGAQRVWRELHSELFDFRSDKIVTGTGILATYVRVLTPNGTTLAAATGGDDLPGFASADGHSELSSYVVVRPGEQASLRFQYVPHITGVPADTYQLTVLKQPGTVAEPLTIQLHLPGSFQVVTAPEGWALQSPGTWLYRTDLRVDRHPQLQWSQR